MHLFLESDRSGTREILNVYSRYGEVTKHNDADFYPFKFKSATGHYTQVMWAHSYKIGCAYAIQSQSNSYQYFVTCNYAKAGNVTDGRVMYFGSRGSRCESGSAPGGANGLCGLTNDAQFRRTIRLGRTG